VSGGNGGTIVDEYASRRRRFLEAAEQLARRDHGIGAARVTCFLAIVVGAAAIIGRSAPRTGTLAVVLGLAALVALIIWHGAVRERLRRVRALARGCETGAHRVQRHWTALPPTPSLPHAPDHAFAGDLNVTGDYSLVRLLPPVTASGGRAVLGEWLLAAAPPSADAIRARQQAIAELVPAIDWREGLVAYAASVSADSTSVEAFLIWAESAGWLHAHPELRWTARILAAAAVVTIVGAFASIVPARAAIAVLVLNALVSLTVGRRVGTTLSAATGQTGRLAGYAKLFRHSQGAPCAGSELQRLLAEMGGPTSSAAFASLDRLVRCAEVRYSPMMHLPLQVLVLWDIHVADALESWQQRHGRAMRRWLAALGELEALGALATLAYENPDWTFPVFADDRAAPLAAVDLAHPLLPADVRVGNDVTIGPPQPILLITGSNMAGKTTLLRAIGLNVVLANAGAPVCSAQLRLPRLRVRTSINATDAPDRGLSLYMAELLRVRAIVDAAHTDADAPLLYLGDELLRGTNADDRRAALVTIMRHLARTSAIGAIATHDTELARDPVLAPYVRPVHLSERFREDAAGPTMWFDYRLQPGLSTSRNAMKLLELVGLNEATLDALDAANA